jgi:hypothetical protein
MQLSRRSFERGQGNIGCILWAAALAVAIMVAWKMVPVKVASAALYDFMDEQAKFAANKPPEKIRKDIVKKAKELKIPLDPKMVQVERTGRRDHISMRVEYTVPVEFPGYTYYWHFRQDLERDIFIF